MNKSALKSFATEARLELLEKIQLQARKLGITPDAIQQASLESSDAIFIDGKPLSDIERKQRNKLIARIKEIGYDRVMEEAAYTWFNRFIALRYMEVNDYLPTKVRVLSSVNPDSTEPDMFKEALNLDLPINKELVYNLKIENNTDALFEYLIKVHCNDLNRYMPFMFETIEGYTEVLFPEGLLGTDTFVRAMTDVNVIPEKDWTNVEIVGWLYQYYISEENERVIQAKKKYKKEEIPYATQLFTPEWIVRYMVQNALGRYWVESHPEHRDLIGNWEYYLENPNSKPDFEEKIAPYINKELNVEEIRCFDPAMGSGHILAYMFDVLYEIYSKCGYMDREIPRLIIEKNLYGLDIDDRAFQLASFTVVMKAVQYNKRFLRSIEREGLEMNLAAIQETNQITEEEIAYLAGEDKGLVFENFSELFSQFKDSKIIGSLIKLKLFDTTELESRINSLSDSAANLFELDIKERLLPLAKKIVQQIKIMRLEYDIFVTNPPYAGNKYIPRELSDYLKRHYPDTKSDLFSAFMEFSINKTKHNGQMGFMTPFVWMFIPLYEKLRGKLINNCQIVSLVQLEYSGFEGATVPICTFTLRNSIENGEGIYIKLTNFKGFDNQKLKTLEAVADPTVNYRYSVRQEKFIDIPGIVLGYWLDEIMVGNFIGNGKLADLSEPRAGLQTGDVNKFLRLWFEVDRTKLGIDNFSKEEARQSGFKWFPHSKGGTYRKWYGNKEYVINWFNDGEDIKRDKADRLSLGLIEKKNSKCWNEEYYFKKGITWTLVSSGKFSVRELSKGMIFDIASNSLFCDEEHYAFFMAYLNSNVAAAYLDVLSPTLNFSPGTIGKLPVIKDIDKEILNKIDKMVNENIYVSKVDWDSVETSWDFKKLRTIGEASKISESINIINEKIVVDRNLVKRNEIQLNEILMNLFGASNSMNSDVSEDEITIKTLKTDEEVKKIISYFVGCLFGRFSIDVEGIVYAGGNFDNTLYRTFTVDSDNIIPILSEFNFNDDIVAKFEDFIRIVFSEETLEENLDFIAENLGKKKNETARETISSYFLNDFFKDHVQTYQKRPIYWLFTSGKEKAFNCLIYMHRYDKTTLSRIRTDYVHEVQNRMDAERTDLLNIINGDSTVKEIAAAKKELKSLEKKIDELKKYDELLHHMADQQLEIDLDDGVKHNYEIFKGLVAKI